jgi:hypothetical protein
MGRLRGKDKENGVGFLPEQGFYRLLPSEGEQSGRFGVNSVFCQKLCGDGARSAGFGPNGDLFPLQVREPFYFQVPVVKDP